MWSRGEPRGERDWRQQPRGQISFRRWPLLRSRESPCLHELSKDNRAPLILGTNTDKVYPRKRARRAPSAEVTCGWKHFVSSYICSSWAQLHVLGLRYFRMRSYSRGQRTLSHKTTEGKQCSTLEADHFSENSPMPHQSPNS